jgi:hypothetical protein
MKNIGNGMPKLKDSFLHKPQESEHQLSDYEFRYLKDLNNALLLHTLRSQIISGYLTYVATQRLGYTKIKEGYMLQYELDTSGDDHSIKIREVPIPEK